MGNLYKYNKNSKATVCSGKNCVTVYGDAAKIINMVIICTVVIVAAGYLAKALR